MGRPSSISLAGALVGQLLIVIRGSAGDGEGRFGSDPSGVMFSVIVTSPVIARRHLVRLGPSAPKRVSMKRSVEVWSNTSDETRPPRANGETTIVGTRKPSPIGPRIPSASGGSEEIVKNSPSVPGGGVGGGTWSKKPPCSSQVTNSTVFAHTSGLLISVETTWLEAGSPRAAGPGGCSVWTSGASTQETDGSWPAATSAWKPCGNVGPNALAASDGFS